MFRARAPLLLIGLAGLLPGAVRADPVPDGRALFEQNCAACHQKSGQGIKGAFPALAGDVLVQGPPKGAAAVVLNGRGGMPAFGPELTDDSIAAVLSYVRGAFGNAAPPIAPAEVASVRAGVSADPHGSPLQSH